jgi:uncharacterized protein
MSPAASAGKPSWSDQRRHRVASLHSARSEAGQGGGNDLAANPQLDIQTAITELAVGEALVSLLDASGRPSITERAFILPPGSQIGPIGPEQRRALLANSLVAGVYDTAIDRESAYEKLKGRAVQSAERAHAEHASSEGEVARGTKSRDRATNDGDMLGGFKDILFGSTGPRGGRRPGIVEATALSAVRNVGTAVGREIVRGVLGSIFGGSRRRR